MTRLTAKLQGAANREAVRAFFVTHVGCTVTECAQALGLGRAAVSRHVSALRAEWSSCAALRKTQDG
ncbi:Bacterial regulatory protein, arsR family [Chelatococcus sambhunathii]|uniref:Bacterial regulatory protein, arsR family n=1 Tax=Chelatococcus sambhunathii TaxID=363953 RepID=A0ABM9U923_9HYPH|nr:Bacterial regulatory protein, arsR family [Chelatococcus sambhunathii]